MRTTGQGTAQQQRRAAAVRPPVRPWAPLACFAVLATVLAVIVLVLPEPRSGLDQADPASQRDGLLRDGPVVRAEVAGVAFGGRPVVLLFVREPPAAAALSRWAAEVPERADARVVLPQPSPADLPVPTVVDPDGRLAREVGMPTPVDGGRPVGYAIVDSSRVVRYATLDADFVSNAFEVATMAGAVR